MTLLLIALAVGVASAVVLWKLGLRPSQAPKDAAPSRLLAAFAVGVAAAAVSSTAIGAEAERLELAYPVLVDAPDRFEVNDLAAGNHKIMVQRVRPLGGAKLSEPYTVEYKPEILDRRFTKGGMRAVTFPAGTLFLRAASTKGDLFCAAGADRAQGMTHFDIGLCFRDANNDGVFDSRFLIEPNLRIRSAFEVRMGAFGNWAVANVPYLRLGLEDMPTAEITASFHYGLTGRRKTPETSIDIYFVYPKELGANVQGVENRQSGGPTTWDPPVIIGGKQQIKRQKVEPGESYEVTYGPYKIRVHLDEAGLADVKMAGFYTPGPALVSLGGFVRDPMAYTAQTSIFAFSRVRQPLLTSQQPGTDQ